MLAQALIAEADSFVAQWKDLKLPDGRGRVVRHGHGAPRTIQTGVGPVEVRRAKVIAQATSIVVPGTRPRWPDLGFGIALGNPIHNRRVALTRSECAHLCHDVLGVAAIECRNACFSSGACWMAARAGGSSHRWVQRARHTAVTHNKTVAEETLSRKQVHGRYSRAS